MNESDELAASLLRQIKAAHSAATLAGLTIFGAAVLFMAAIVAVWMFKHWDFMLVMLGCGIVYMLHCLWEQE